MINWDSVVLAPTQAIFGKPIVVMPLASQPSALPYLGRGIWTVKPIDVQMEDGAIMSSQTNVLAVRLSEYVVPIVPGDQIVLDGVTYLVDDTDDDGQGATDLTLKEIHADLPP